MNTIRIFFADMWRGFEMENNYFVNLLSKRFKLEITDRPDFLIFGPYGYKHHKFKCIRIFYTPENVRPNFWACDYAFSFDNYFTARHYRLPLYALYADVSLLTASKDIAKVALEKTRFCNFVYSNGTAKERILFLEKLSKYKKVDSGGGVLNNLGYKVQNKLEFLADYKFTIAFENTSQPGYTTEKIFQPMLVNSIPIYWGNPEIDNDFNTASFLNVHNFQSHDEVIERIIEIDKNDNLYHELLRQPYFDNNEVPKTLESETILNQFEKIFHSDRVDRDLVRFSKLKLSFLNDDIHRYSKALQKKIK